MRPLTDIQAEVLRAHVDPHAQWRSAAEAERDEPEKAAALRELMAEGLACLMSVDGRRRSAITDRGRLALRIHQAFKLGADALQGAA